MQHLGIFELVTQKFCCGDTHGKKSNRNEITKNGFRFSLEEVFAQKDDVSGLSIRKDFPPGDVGVSVLEAAGKREQGGS